MINPIEEKVIKGRWNQTRNEAKKQWSKLTEEDLDYINGDRDKLIEKVRERYGHDAESAELEYKSWASALIMGSNR
ncbi:hypothetical protein [Saccharibacillus kuerlensis]|uniref:UPF0337 protein n=1 Tax=Saccharibacillus kuerlensis TaxID=459527 RepID=A0ABQ2L237_9BACL|nr:hypothetical protein [Saccharibacillus kuerlensis]GGN99739.1 UPF0337 protein [Saccharibacillus kuerlensis]